MKADPQADRVYRAELTVDPGAQLYAADQLRRYVGFVTSSDWWTGHGWPGVAVHTGRTANAWGGRLAMGSWYIGLPGWPSPELEDEARRAVFASRPVEWPWAWNERTICHELAHVTHLFDIEGRARPSAHGAAWCGRYLHTVEAVCGAEARWRLERAFDRHSVAYETSEHDREPLGPDALHAALWRPYRPSAAPRRPTPARQGVLL